ncbi:NAD-dependent epimerase/dehydratase family protein [Segatella paludivivens]|uniref:NAD-dependent epimerase/dehydratase family protein n=1 Tax=Segatella paludivivens TaxID=185294 RepID=UPI0003786065|nr:NAD-dependent epimerase/dehydratase family protein [Segatella paludivivens]
MKVLIAGGNEFIGRTLIPFLVKKGNEVNVLTRRTMTDVKSIRYYRWDVDQEFIDSKAFNGVNTLINMTETNNDKKQWIVDLKNEILNSRVKLLNFLLKSIKKFANKIKVLIYTSAVEYYKAVTTDHVLKYNEIDGVFNIVSNEHLNMNEFSDKMLYSFNRRRLYPNMSEWVVGI